MRRRRRPFFSTWQPEARLSYSTWSLVPNVGLSIRARWLILSGLAVALLLVWLTGWVPTSDAIAALVLGAWPAFYLCERLGNRPAPFPRSVDDAAVDELSSFWERLALDAIAVVGLAVALALAFAGLDAIGRTIEAVVVVLKRAT